MNKKYIEPELKITYFYTETIMENILQESKTLNAQDLFEGDTEVKAVTGIQWADLK